MENNFRNTPINQFETVTQVNQNVLLRNSFSWMSLALVLTSLTSMLFGFVPFLAEFLTQSKLTFYIAMFAPLIFVFIIGARFEKMSFAGLAATFVAYSLVNGISLSFVFWIFELGSILNVFLSTAALFGIMAVAGYATKTDLTKLGSILTIGLIGILIASVINWFMGSEQMGFVISILGVIIFTGLTAYDVQKIKNLGMQYNDGSATMQKLGIMGALTLYLDFINLFLFLLRLFGGKK